MLQLNDVVSSIVILSLKIIITQKSEMNSFENDWIIMTSRVFLSLSFAPVSKQIAFNITRHKNDANHFCGDIVFSRFLEFGFSALWKLISENGAFTAVCYAKTIPKCHYYVQYFFSLHLPLPLSLAQKESWRFPNECKILFACDLVSGFRFASILLDSSRWSEQQFSMLNITMFQFSEKKDY